MTTPPDAAPAVERPVRVDDPPAIAIDALVARANARAAAAGAPPPALEATAGRDAPLGLMAAAIEAAWGVPVRVPGPKGVQ
jgi:hypothetical protein